MLRALLVAAVTGAPVERRELMLRHRQPRPWVHLQGIRPARQADEPVPRRTGVAPAVHGHAQRLERAADLLCDRSFPLPAAMQSCTPG